MNREVMMSSKPVTARSSGTRTPRRDSWAMTDSASSSLAHSSASTGASIARIWSTATGPDASSGWTRIGGPASSSLRRRRAETKPS